MKDKDILQNGLESMVKKLLKEARGETFDNKLNALKVAIVWFTHSRKLGAGDSTSGSLIEEMRKAIG